MLGRLQTLPTPEVFRHAQVGNGPVERAGVTEDLGASCRHQPVAGVVGDVGAKPARPVCRRERSPPAIFLPCEGAENGQVRQIAEKVSAALAAGVLEEEQLAAVLALEQLHELLPLVSASTDTKCGLPAAFIPARSPARRRGPDVVA